MLGFFTDPYPDELLYSACARYAKRAHYLNKQSVIKELFGKRGISATIDFPTRLQYFISVLPFSHKYSAKKLTNENTLLPFHEPFLIAERVEIIRREMQSKSNNKLQLRLGTKAKQIENPKYLRYCPYCAKQDRLNYGETFWHRIHQLGGIPICSIHHCFLKDSLIELGRFSAKLFHEAEESIPQITTKIEHLKSQNEDHQILLKIAKDAEWLLSNSNVSVNCKTIRDRYFNILLKQGYAYYNGRIKHSKLLNACKSFFSQKLFELIGKISKKDDWLSVLVDKGNIYKTYHPIRHLLLITFLGLTAKDFFTSFIEFKPFGDPPYPCLNLASNHYKRLCIQECKVFDNLTKNEKFRGPIAVFSCKCGFIYQRLGPDESEEDKFRYSSIREYGVVWENKLATLWTDLSLSSAEIARRVGVNQTSVGRHAIRLNLPVNSDEARSLQGYDRHRNPKIPFSRMLQNYRKKWLQTRLKYPEFTRLELSHKENFVYQWLKRNDLEWIENHLPAPSKTFRKKERLNWKEIDVNLYKLVKSACREIKNNVGVPVRVSITEIIRRVGNRVWIDKRKKKLPRTSKIIDDNLETLEEFMIRKVKVITKAFIAEKKLPSLVQFERRAVIRNSTSRNSKKIQKAVKDALIEIKNSLSL